MDKFISEERVKKIILDAFDQEAGETVGDILNAAINQALTEQRNAIADWIEAEHGYDISTYWAEQELRNTTRGT